jgi:hypothetical protein
MKVVRRFVVSAPGGGGKAMLSSCDRLYGMLEACSVAAATPSAGRVENYKIRHKSGCGTS